MKWTRILDRGGLVRVVSAALLIDGSAMAGSPVGDARGKPAAQDRPVAAGTEGRPGGLATDQGRPGPPPVASGAPRDVLPKAATPSIEFKSTEIHTAIPPVAGATLVLEVDRQLRDGARFLWLQVDGPPVEFKDANQPTIQFQIPAGADHLGFVLVAARTDRTIVYRIRVPLPAAGLASSESGPTQPERGPRGSGKTKAHAGDDQVGLVGHRVTLNGSRSVPADGKTARWLQVEGPPIIQPQQQGPFFSFVPSSPGRYRFLLMVSGGETAPDVDDVTVLVGTPPGGGLTVAPSAAPAAMPAPPPSPPTAEALERALAGSFSRLTNGPAVASQVADALQAVAERTPLYTSFAEMQLELVRRLDVIVPAEPAQRAAWSENVFSPLTSYTSSHLLAAGIDARQPRGLDLPLSSAQRERLQDHLQSLARVFRAAAPIR
jgi:hypothetical protein